MKEINIYSWFISIVDRDKRITIRNSTLSIKNIDVKDSNEYICTGKVVDTSLKQIIILRVKGMFSVNWYAQNFGWRGEGRLEIPLRQASQPKIDLWSLKRTLIFTRKLGSNILLKHILIFYLNLAIWKYDFSNICGSITCQSAGKFSVLFDTI